MVIGTGISCGVVVDGTLLRHTLNTSGDTGHVIVDPDGATACVCGGHGCLDALASAGAIRAVGLEAARTGASPMLGQIYAQVGDIAAHDVTAAASRGDAVATAILNRVGHLLGVALTSLMHIYLPNVILIGGGVSAAGDLLLEPARRTIDHLAASYFRAQLSELRIAALGADAGIVGAASLMLFGPTDERTQSAS